MKPTLSLYINKILHFYPNKYIISNFTSKHYHLSYSFAHKALWYRVYKVGSRTINQRLMNDARGNYLYSSSVGYCPKYYRNYFKFGFVRNPVDRFVSCWKDKVLNKNYFGFSEDQRFKMKDIESFIDWVESEDIVMNDGHLIAQCKLIDLNNVDFIGRFERFEADFEVVAERLNLGDYSLEALNRTMDSSISTDESVKRRIVKLYEDDVRHFYPELLQLI